MQIEKGIDKVVKTVRLMILDKPGQLGKVASAIGAVGGNIGDIRLVTYGLEYNTRTSPSSWTTMSSSRRSSRNSGRSRRHHLRHHRPRPGTSQGRQIDVKSRIAVDSISIIRKIYTPGVAKVCRLIERDPGLAYEYTAINNSVAIVTTERRSWGWGHRPRRGDAGHGGKAVLFDALVGISGYPILIGSKDPEEIIRTVVAIAPTYGAIKLEDIKAPEASRSRTARRDPRHPVMHDDQHGTAVVVLAALLNASRYVGMQVKNDCVGMVGLGAAGMGSRSC